MGRGGGVYGVYDSLYVRYTAFCCQGPPKLNKARLGDTIVNNEEAGLSVVFGGREWGPLHVVHDELSIRHFCCS